MEKIKAGVLYLQEIDKYQTVCKTMETFAAYNMIDKFMAVPSTVTTQTMSKMAIWTNSGSINVFGDNANVGDNQLKDDDWLEAGSTPPPWVQNDDLNSIFNKTALYCNYINGLYQKIVQDSIKGKKSLAKKTIKNYFQTYIGRPLVKDISTFIDIYYREFLSTASGDDDPTEDDVLEIDVDLQ